MRSIFLTLKVLLFGKLILFFPLFRANASDEIINNKKCKNINIPTANHEESYEYISEIPYQEATSVDFSCFDDYIINFSDSELLDQPRNEAPQQQYDQ